MSVILASMLDVEMCLCDGCKRGIEFVYNANKRAGILTIWTVFELVGLRKISWMHPNAKLRA